MYLFFDTETTGKPKDYQADMRDIDNWPRVIQLAYLQFDAEGNRIDGFSELIKPDGWTVPKKKFWIENGFSTEQNEAHGVPISIAFDYFLKAYDNSDFLLAHNMNFDYNVLGAELIRANRKATKKADRICTMLSSTDYCKLPGKYGYKWPSLSELHIKLFGHDFDNAHDALADVEATAKCFFELKKIGAI